jgi:hypothetical protein
MEEATLSITKAINFVLSAEPRNTSLLRWKERRGYEIWIFNKEDLEKDLFPEETS